MFGIKYFIQLTDALTDDNITNQVRLLEYITITGSQCYQATDRGFGVISNKSGVNYACNHQNIDVQTSSQRGILCETHF